MTSLIIYYQSLDVIYIDLHVIYIYRRVYLYIQGYNVYMHVPTWDILLACMYTILVKIRSLQCLISQDA